LNGNGSEPIDPFLLEDRIDPVTFRLGNAADAYWHYSIRMDPTEMLEFRLDQKVYLARYTGINPFVWEDKEVTELQSYYRATCKLVKLENNPKRSG
jgi:hypothetical protein